ncbi:MAG: hypothetical protein WKF77_15335 [Planctomycetaceae bacterium]
MNRFGSVSIHTPDRSSCFVLGCWIFLIASACCLAQEPPANVRAPQRWAVILGGLPGDAEHAAPFRRMADTIQKWLSESQQIPTEQILRLPIEAAAEAAAEATAGEASSTPPTAEAIRTMFADLNTKLRTDDALWVFTLGHGNYDGRHAWFHVAGKDLSSEDFGKWLADVPCREQVIWLTHSGSGWFVKPLSRPGRIVIAATAADDESNETEFPWALATVVKSPVTSLDSDQDKAVSVAELYDAVVNEVSRRFKHDGRLPTEHAQLDDNGDGAGIEDLNQTKSDDPSAAAPQVPPSKVDGDLARTTFIPYPDVEPEANEPPPAE